MAAGLSLLVAWNARGNHSTRLPRTTFAEVLTELRQGVWALLAPLVVLAGIYGGAFTLTEAAAVVCLYSLLVGVFIEKRLAVRDLPKIFINALRISAINAVSNGFGILVAQEQLATKLAGALGDAISQPWLTLLVLNLVFFLPAAVMDEVAIMVMLSSMLIAIANRFGVDPIHFGAIRRSRHGCAANRLLPVCEDND